MHNPSLKRTRIRGFSILDGLIATLVIMIIAFLMIPVFVQTYSVQGDAEDFLTADNLARQKVEELKALGFEGVPRGETSEDSEDGRFTIQSVVAEQFSVTGVEGSPDLPRRVVKIEVTVIRKGTNTPTMSKHITFIHKRGI